MGYRLGIVGAGNMAEAIARGVLQAKVLAPSEIVCCDVSADRRAAFSNELAVRAMETGEALAATKPEVVLFSVKPQQMADALRALGARLEPRTLIISIAAGISSGFIESSLGEGVRWRVIRSMPNTPMLFGEGMVAVSAGRFAMREDVEAARRIFESAASVIEVPEHLMDAVTAVSGSGPAYVFYLAEQMIAAGIELGLSPEDAAKMVSKTVAGAATMLQRSAEPPEALRRKVTSPGGTTEAAIAHLEQKGVGVAFLEAVKTAAQRSKELGAQVGVGR